jgi:hypothetical protein
MRIAAEAVDDRLVTQFEGEVALHSRRGEKFDRLGVNQRRLAVHVGHVEEGAARRVDGAVGAGGDGFLGESQRQRVGGEGFRAIAEDVAGELVEDEDLGQSAVAAAAPGV